MTRPTLGWILPALALVACSSEDDGPDTTEPEATGSLGAPLCERGVIEADFQSAPLAGPGTVDGAVRSGEYLLSTTYLQIRGDDSTQQLFEELLSDVTADLRARPGLLALGLGISPQCGTARTLGVWQDDAAMLAFVVAPPHAAAMSRVTDLSRGGSVVTHWLGDETEAAWGTAAQQLGADDLRLY